jgi:hypothetical protein
LDTSLEMHSIRIIYKVIFPGEEKERNTHEDVDSLLGIGIVDQHVPHKQR